VPTILTNGGEKWGWIRAPKRKEREKMELSSSWKKWS